MSAAGSSRPTLGRSARWVILGSVLLGNFAAGTVFTLLSVARQTVAENLGSTSSVITWAFTGPSLAGAVVGPALGRLGDLRGHRRLYLASLAGGTVCAVLVSQAWDAGSLIAFRTVAALFGAALTPSSLALVFRAFEREERVRAMGYWSLVNAGSPVIGVLIGGPVIERFGWRWMFLGQVPLFLISLVVGIRVLTETPRRDVQRFDAKGAVLLALSTLCVLLPVNRGPHWGWSDPRVIAGFVLFPCLLSLFVASQRQASAPLLPLPLLRNRNVVASIGAQTLSQFAYLGAGLFLLNDLLVDPGRFGFSLAEASRYTIARPIAMAFVGPIAGTLAIRYGARITATSGMAILTVAMVLFAAPRPGSSLALVVLATALTGLGSGMANPSLTTSVANSVPESMLGTIGATQQVMSQIGSVVGTVVIGTLAGTDGARSDASYRLAFVVAAVVAGCAAVVASQLRRRPPKPSTTAPGAGT